MKTNLQLAIRSFTDHTKVLALTRFALSLLVHILCTLFPQLIILEFYLVERVCDIHFAAYNLELMAFPN